MTSTTKLFRILELTRSMPQYGYVLAEIPKAELSDLAQHHYLVTIMAWKLAQQAVAAGGNLNIEKVLEICLVHDLGELFGGDIAMPYYRANPAARPFAKAFEAENYRFLSEQFGDQRELVKQLGEELEDPSTDEGVLMKVADYLECTHYKAYVHRLTPNDVSMVVKQLEVKIEKVHDEKTRDFLSTFIAEWAAEMSQAELAEVFETAKLT